MTNWIAAILMTATVVLPFLFRTPARADDRAETRPETTRSEIRAKAWAIAERSVSGNIATVGDKQLILAGRHQFRTLWARDMSMSVQGALSMGATSAVRDSLEEMLSQQRSDGLLPRAVDDISIQERVLLAILGASPRFKAPLHPWFVTESDVNAIDSNVIVPWAASLYVTLTGDVVSARRWFPTLEKSLGFVEAQHLTEGLIGDQPPFSDWEDSIRRTGRVAITNIYYILALRGAAEIAKRLGEPEKAESYALRALSVTASFRDYFWAIDKKVLRNFEGDNHLTADANLMAIVYHILPDEESRQVLEVLHASPLWYPMPGRPTYPRYSASLKTTNVRFAGIPGYHDTMYWLWITALAARAEATLGNCAAYESIMDQLSARVVHDNTFYEVFNLKTGTTILKPVHSWLYKAEQPLTWNAAMYLEAASTGCR